MFNYIMKIGQRKQAAILPISYELETRDQSTSKTEAHWNEQHLIKILHIKRVEID